MAIKAPQAERTVGTAPTQIGTTSASFQPFQGRAGAAAVDVATKIFRDEQDKAFKSRMSEEDRAMNNWGLDNIYDSQTGFRSRLGTDAYSIPDDFDEGWSKFVEEREQGLADDRQKAAFRDIAEIKRQQHEGWINNHVFKQGQVADKLEFSASIDSTKQIGAQSAANIPAALETIDLTIQARGDDQGWSPTVISNKIREEGIDLYTQAIESNLANEDTDEAEELFREAKDKFGSNAFSEDFKSRVGASTVNAKASGWTSEAWDAKGPKNDRDAAETDKMIAYVNSHTENEKVRKSATSMIKDRALIHDKSVAERETANNDTVSQMVADDAPTEVILASAEYKDLSGSGQLKWRDKLNSYAEADRKRLVTSQKAEVTAKEKEQKIQAKARVRDISTDPTLLATADLEDEWRKGNIDKTGRDYLQKLRDDSLKAGEAKIATGFITNALKDSLFDDDPFINAEMAAAMENDLERFVLEHGDMNAVEYIQSRMEPIEKSFVERALDIFNVGAPGTEEFYRRRAEQELKLRNREVNENTLQIVIDELKRAEAEDAN